MEFEWDDAKNIVNRQKHNIDFADAVHVFIDKNRVYRKDTRQDYGEERYQTLGMTKFGVLMVVYTFRESNGIIGVTWTVIGSYMDGHSKRGSFVFLLEFTPDDPAGLLSR